MWTVIVSTPGSGSVRIFRPLASRYSVTPSMETVFCGSSAAAARPAAARRSRAGRSLLFLASSALLPQAGAQLVAFLVLARGMSLGALLGQLLRPRLALAGLLRARAHLGAHAVAPLGALLAFARGPGLLERGAHLLASLLAGLGVLRLRAVEAPRRLAGVGCRRTLL